MKIRKRPITAADDLSVNRCTFTPEDVAAFLSQIYELQGLGISLLEFLSMRMQMDAPNLRLATLFITSLTSNLKAYCTEKAIEPRFWIQWLLLYNIFLNRIYLEIIPSLSPHLH